MLLLLSEFGMSMANIYFIGKKEIKTSVLSYNSLIFGLLSGLISVFIFFIIYQFINNSMFKGIDSVYIHLVLIIIPFSLTTKYLDSILIGLLKIKQSCYIDILYNIASTIGIVIILLVLLGGIKDLLIFSLIMGNSLFIFYILYIEKLTGFARNFSWNSFKKCFGYSSKGYISNALNFFIYRIDIVMVNFFIGVTAVGYYSLSVALAEMLWIVPSATSFVLFPVVSSNNKSESSDLVAVVCRNVFFLTLLLGLLTMLFGRYVIIMFYGTIYRPAFLPLFILLPGTVLGSISASITPYLAGIGKPIYAMYASIFIFIFNIVSNILLIPILGIAGAALTSTIGYSISTFYYIMLFLRFSNYKLRDILIIKKEDIIRYKELLLRPRSFFK